MKWLAAVSIAVSIASHLVSIGASEPTLEATGQDRPFWSFQPVVRPGVPETGVDGARHPIDAFVFRKLKASGLSPSPLASRRELVRRVHFDITGLPPTPGEVDAFVTDDSPDAYERLVNELLARPQYGERWGRHWLDLVRYAQTAGYERDDEKPNSWRYRDYVVQAFNQDRPYDQFIVEQLAGDELPEVSHESIIATGFYRVGVWDDEPDDKVLATWDELDDIVRTTGETFLGLTIGCARCHEHKTDPIPQEDYYRLLAFFRNVAPYGKDDSATHWKIDPHNVFTPLVTRDDVTAFRKRESEHRQNVEALKERVAALGDAKENAEEKKSLEQEIQTREKEMELPFEYALSVRELGPTTPKTHLLIRGSPLTLGPEVQPGFPTALNCKPPAIVPPNMESSSFGRLLSELGVKQTSGRRLALARWIASAENPLTARVMANRLWHYHFGRGLVSTPSDFGKTGLRPSHPELLDWLAADLVDGGWRLKRMHKMILMSHTYRQSSRSVSPHALSVDPDNTLLWRQSLRRLDAECIRDAILAVNGRLNLKTGGRGIFPILSPEILATQSVPGNGWDNSTESERARRSLYIFVKRTLTVPLMAGFDQATADKPQPARTTTTIAPQALMLLNSEFMDSNAVAFADRAVREVGGDRSKQVDHVYRMALGRLPVDRERQIALGFLDRQKPELTVSKENDGGTPERLALTAFCRMVFNLNEFVYID